MKKLKMLLIGNAKSILFRITNKWNYWCRKILIVPNIRKKLNNTSKINNSFLCNNCTGAMMMHDLGGRFDSPTVNLWMSPKDFIYLVKNIKELSKMDILEITPPSKNVIIQSACLVSANCIFCTTKVFEKLTNVG